MHSFHDRFESVGILKLKLMEEFKENVPKSLEFGVGYFSGRQNAKHWLMCEEDLKGMYKSLKSGYVLLWCDACTPTTESKNELEKETRKRKQPSPSAPISKRQQAEDDIDDLVRVLKRKHGDKYNMPQLRLWARMVSLGNHESTDDPPKIPAITGIVPKKEKATLVDVISSAATTFAQALKPQVSVCAANNSTVVNQTSPSKIPSTGVDISPVRSTELQKLQELRELQQLLEGNVITVEEFAEQQVIVLDSLHKLI